MTRKIKFRAWHKNLLEMQNDVHLLDRLAYILSRPETYEIMQFTGLKDKNGKDIYEGDIIKRMSSKEYIEWNKEEAAFFTRTKIWDGDMLGILLTNKVEVIGNIYQHPELLTS